MHYLNVVLALGLLIEGCCANNGMDFSRKFDGTAISLYTGLQLSLGILFSHAADKSLCKVIAKGFPVRESRGPIFFHGIFITPKCPILCCSLSTEGESEGDFLVIVVIYVAV